MALNFNNATPKKILYNGLNVAKLIYNGVVVWLAKVLTKLTGYPITLTNSVGDDLVDYKVYGESVQDGEATPDTPIEIESVGDKTYNIMTPTKINKTISGVTIVTQSDGSIVCNGTAESDIQEIVGNFKITAGLRHKGSGCPKGGSTSTYRLFFIYIGADLGSGTSAPIAPDDHDSSVHLCIYKGQVCDNLTFYPMVVNLENKTDILEYEPYGYKVPVKVSGKNFLSELKYVNIYNNTETDNIETAVFLKAGEYTLSIGKLINCTTWRLYFKLWDKNGNRILNNTGGTLSNLSEYGTFSYIKSNGDKRGFYWNYSDNSNRQSILMQDSMDVLENPKVSLEFNNDYYVRFYLYNGDVNSSTIAENPQLERGTEVTEYKPYIEPVTTNIYLDEPLRKIRDYVDYIDFENEKVVRNICSENLKATAISSTGSNNGNLALFYMSQIDRLIIKNKEIVQVLSNNLKGSTYNEYTSNTYAETESIAANINNGAIFFKIKKEVIGGDTVDLCNSYLTTNPILIYFILTTPTEEPIDLPNIPTHQGTNIIEIDTTIKPSNMEVQYYAKGV